jgi:peptide/nickel transport system permease protein
MANTGNSSVSDLQKKYKKSGMSRQVWRRFKKNKTAMLGLIIITLIVIMALIAPLIYDYNEDVIKQNIKEKLQAPSPQHFLGTDHVGRDVLARIIWGARASVFIGLAAVALAFIVGGALGSIAGFYGGRVDGIIMRIMDIFLAIPGTLFAITLMAALGKSIPNLVIALTISTIPGFARIVRGSVLIVRDVDYIEAAKAIGCKNSRIIFQHVLPNSLAPVIVHTTLSVATVILTIAGLSYLGLGISAPMPEWGQMLAEARNYIINPKYTYLTLFPGLSIMITILALNLLGDGLRDALDPRLK